MAKLKFDTFGNEAQKSCFSFLFAHPEITEIWYGGAAGWWKSFTGTSWGWMLCNKYPGIRFFFGRQELKRLKQTTLVTYFKFCDEYDIPMEQRGVYNAQDSVIRFANGSEILLLDLSYKPSDPLYTRFGSLELTSGYVDESAEVDEKCIGILMTRIGRHRNEEYGLAPKILEWFNPDKGHVYRRYYKPYKDGKMPAYRKFIPALATDNKRLPKSYIEQLKKSDEITKQRLLYGNFDYDDSPGRLFEYDALHDLFTNPKENGDVFISIDVARKGKDTTRIFVWNGLEIVDIITETISDMYELGERIKRLCQKLKVPASRVVVDENGVGWGLVDNLRCQGFINNAKAIQPKNPNLSQKRNFEHLKTQCYWELAKLVNARRISVSANVTEEMKADIIEELDAVVQIDIDKDWPTRLIKKEDVIAKINRSPDYSDAMMMRMIYEVKKFSVIDEWDGKRERPDRVEKDPILDDDDFEMTIDGTPFSHPYDL